MSEEMLHDALRTDRVVLIAAVLRPGGRDGGTTLLPLRVLETDGTLNQRCIERGVFVVTEGEAAPAGSVVRWERDGGVERVSKRYDDVTEFLSAGEPVAVLLNALWVLHRHGCRGERERTLRLLVRLEAHPDARVRTEARAVSAKL